MLHREQLNHAMVGQDLGYANLTRNDIDRQAKNIVDAMSAASVKRIFVASLGISSVYDEVPDKFGEWNRREIGLSIHLSFAHVEISA